MTNPTPAITINAAFLLEIKEDNTELDRLLSASRAAASDIVAHRAGWRQFTELLGRLRDDVAMHFALEEAYGYFENPAFDTPGLDASTALLRDEHQALYSEICAVVDRVEQQVYQGVQDGTPQQIAWELTAFCDDLLHHDTQEYALILRVAPLRKPLLAARHT